MKAKSKIRVKEGRLDTLFSLLIRGRVDYTCEARVTTNCDGSYGQMQCSHLFGRRHRSTRFFPTNAACHCSSCHRYLTENPYEFGKWIERHLGKQGAEELRLRAHTTLKRSPAQTRDLFNEMTVALRDMQERRAMGLTGRLEFYLEVA